MDNYLLCYLRSWIKKGSHWVRNWRIFGIASPEGGHHHAIWFFLDHVCNIQSLFEIRTLIFQFSANAAGNVRIVQSFVMVDHLQAMLHRCCRTCKWQNIIKGLFHWYELFAESDLPTRKLGFDGVNVFPVEGLNWPHLIFKIARDVMTSPLIKRAFDNLLIETTYLYCADKTLVNSNTKFNVFSTRTE